MDLRMAEAMAYRLMAQHCEPGWKFRWDRSKSQGGVTNFTTKTITLSAVLTPHKTPEQVEQTMLHEIAHTKAGHRAGHGPLWLREARAIGYTGGRTEASTEAVRSTYDHLTDHAQANQRLGSPVPSLAVEDARGWAENARYLQVD